MAERPILFNTDMVKAILEGRKTQTRRLVKGIPLYEPYFEVVDGEPMVCDDNGDWHLATDFSRIQPGDVLWVRETWNGLKLGQRGKEETSYWYRADEDEERLNPDDKWHPSIHMPREAARIFLKVKDVRVERLQDIDANGIRAEGLTSAAVHCGDMEIALKEWALLWNSTIKKADLPRYGWSANPWVWVIEFKREDREAGT